MFPHLSSGSPAHQRAHQHYTATCPLDCPARRAPHQAQHYASQNNSRSMSAARHSQLDPSVLHPAFSGLFYQQRRNYSTQSYPPPPPSSVPSTFSSSLPPPPTGALPSSSSLSSQPYCMPTGGNMPIVGGAAGHSGPTQVHGYLDPAKISPIFYGYSLKQDKPKL